MALLFGGDFAWTTLYGERRVEGARQYPRWLLILALLVVVTAHTQLTVRHLALWLAGVRFGEVENVLEQSAVKGLRDHQGALFEVLGETAVLHDPLGVYRSGELRNKRICFGDDSFVIAANTPTHIEVYGSMAEIERAVAAHPKYLTGFKKKNILVKLALRTPRLAFTMADLVFALALLALAAWLLCRRQKPVAWLPPPLPVIVLLAVCFISMFDWARLFDHSQMEADGMKSLTELAQYVEILLLAWLFFRELFCDRRLRRWLIWALAGGAAVVILVGLIEYMVILSGVTRRGLAAIGDLDSIFGFQYNPGRSRITGSESSRNILALYLLLAVPVLLALSAAPFRRAVRIGLAILAALGLCLILSLPLLICTVLGCLLVACLWRHKPALPAVAGVILLILLLMCLVNRQHGRILLDSAALYRSRDTYGLLPMPAKGQGQTTFGEWESWQQKYLERQAALTAVSWSPLFGLGIGNYQAKINTFYTATLPGLEAHQVEKKAANLMEKDTHSLYLVQAVETGVLGVMALLWLLIYSLKQAFAARAAAADPWEQALLTGVAGSLLALILGGFYGSFMVRGVHFLAIVLMALPAAVLISTRPAGDRQLPATPGDAAKETLPEKRRQKN